MQKIFKALIYVFLLATFANAEHLGTHKVSTNIKASLTDTGGGSNIDKVYAEVQDGNFAAVTGAPLTVTEQIAGKAFSAQIATGSTAGQRSVLWSYIYDDLVTIPDASGTATSSTASILTDTGASLSVDAYINGKIEITGGTGNGQIREVSDNDATSVTVSKDFTITPDNTSTYALYLPANVTRVRDTFAVTANLLDDITTDIAAVPTVAEIDAQLISTHGSGSWAAVSGDGAYSAVIAVKDGSSNAVANAYVTIHNSNNDDAPIVAEGSTNALGQVTFNLQNGLYVRVNKVGYTFTSTAINVTASATYTVTGTVNTITPPTDPALCKLYLFPKTLDNQEISGLTITISSTADTWVKVDDQLISKDTGVFTYDSSTNPDSYYFNAIQGVVVYVKSKELGFSEEITVPAVSSKNLYDLLAK